MEILTTSIKLVLSQEIGAGTYPQLNWL